MHGVMWDKHLKTHSVLYFSSYLRNKSSWMASLHPKGPVWANSACPAETPWAEAGEEKPKPQEAPSKGEPLLDPVEQFSSFMSCWKKNYVLMTKEQRFQLQNLLCFFC